MTRSGICILVVLLLASVSAWGGVQVSWTDAAGSHVADLTCLSNPDYVPPPPAGPGTLEPAFAWQGAITVDMSAPVTFTISGNFVSDQGVFGDLWTKVRLDQTVVNSTGSPWAGFYLDLANLPQDPNAARNPSFYKIAQFEPSDWDPYIWYGGMHETYDALDTVTGPFVAPGGTFHDVCWVDSDVDFTTGDGGFLLKKYAVCVPEPGSIAALCSCLAGLAIFARKRKA
jgi:hypothetical protein